MASKRKVKTSGSLENSKRRRFGDNDSDEDRRSSAPVSHVDPTYGQRGAFPGLDEPSEGHEEYFYGPATDGFEYLRMVR